MSQKEPNTTPTPPFITPDALLEHWQGHRRLTRRVIDTFPEDQLFTFAVAGMRPFGALAGELIRMAVPFTRGVVTEAWETFEERDLPTTKEGLLARWDLDTSELDALWSRIPPERFHGRTTAFGQWEGVVLDLTLYLIDNEVHHRAQGFVYLRALGVEPPPFWERD